MIGAAIALIAAQAGGAVSTPNGLDLFRAVCVDRSLAVDSVNGAPVAFSAMTTEARGALERLNNASETLDADGGPQRAIALPGGATYLVVPAQNADSDAHPAPSCIVVWKGDDLTAARSYRPPYEAHVAWESTESNGWIVLRAIPDAFSVPPPR